MANEQQNIDKQVKEALGNYTVGAGADGWDAMNRKIVGQEYRFTKFNLRSFNIYYLGVALLAGLVAVYMYSNNEVEVENKTEVEVYNDAKSQQPNANSHIEGQSDKVTSSFAKATEDKEGQREDAVGSWQEKQRASEDELAPSPAQLRVQEGENDVEGKITPVENTVIGTTHEARQTAPDVMEEANPAENLKINKVIVVKDTVTVRKRVVVKDTVRVMRK